MAPRRLDLRAVAGGGRPAPAASASQGQPPGSARDELPLTARSRPKLEGHAIDDAELALTHAQEGTRLASALEDHGAVVLSTRSALLHEFAAKRCGLVFAVPAPVVAVAHDDDDDYSVTPTESEDETDVRPERFVPRLVKVAPSEVFYCAPADDPAALAASSIAEAPPNAVGVAEDVASPRATASPPQACGNQIFNPTSM
ncbi:hypothetical protein JL720_11141 [Aureococcus anophagefferens]|nr:hypothetical protein JL720_11141 [Aureococcus anophagefferens]